MKKRERKFWYSYKDPNLILISRYQFKSSLKVLIFDKFDPDTKFHNKRMEIYLRGRFMGFLESGWLGDESEVYEYVSNIETTIFRKKKPYWNKIQKRRLLRLIRNFPLHSGTSYGNFLNCQGNVVWDNVWNYENKYKIHDNT